MNEKFQSFADLQTMKFGFLIFLPLLLSAVEAKLREEDKNCVDYAFHNKTLKTSDECKKFFDDQKAKFLKEFEPLFNCSNGTPFANWFCDEKCATEAFESSRISDLFMKGLISHLHNKTEENEDESDDIYLKIYEKSRKLIFETIAMKCMDSKLAAVTLKSMIEFVKSTSETERKCRVRHAIERKYFDPADYNLNAASLESHDCNSNYEMLDEEFSRLDLFSHYAYSNFGVNDETIRNCMTHKNKFPASFFMRFRAIAALDLSSEQLTNLENVFMNSAKSYGGVFLECVKNYCSVNCDSY